MSDKLKNFIHDNRRLFDDEQPGEEVWNRIDESIVKKEPARFFSIRDIYKWSAVAAVFFVALTCVYFLVWQKPAPENVTALPKDHRTELATFAPEYAAEATRFFQTIQVQQQQLKTMAADQPQLYSQFAEDLATLDSSYNVLKTQAIQAPGRELILKAMMQNLQLQAALLQKQLQIIIEFNNHKNNSNEENNHRDI